MKKIGTIGEILVEIMALDPGHGFREPLRLEGPYPSGAPAIFIDQAAPFPARERDPTGAGDCFGATFVTCWLRDMPRARALALAAASGARAVERQGPMEGTSTLAELEAMGAR